MIIPEAVEDISMSTAVKKLHPYIEFGDDVDVAESISGQACTSRAVSRGVVMLCSVRDY